MNLYEWLTPNPTPKSTCPWGLDKSYKIVRVGLYEFVRISHLVKYIRIGREIALIKTHFRINNIRNVHCASVILQIKFNYNFSMSGF